MASDFSLDLPLPRARSSGEPAFLAWAKRGDHDAYASLVRPYERVAYRVATAITGTHADAEEAIQNGFVKAYRSLRRFGRARPSGRGCFASSSTRRTTSSATGGVTSGSGSRRRAHERAVAGPDEA